MGALEICLSVHVYMYIVKKLDVWGVLCFYFKGINNWYKATMYIQNDGMQNLVYIQVEEFIHYLQTYMCVLLWSILT